MVDPLQSDALNTTLVREGLEASTREDLVRFADEVERRPIRQLLEDLPGLARLSRDKFDLVLDVIRARIARQPLAVRERIAAQIDIWAGSTENAEVASRLKELVGETGAPPR